MNTPTCLHAHTQVCVHTRVYTKRHKICHQLPIKGQEAKHRHHDVWSLYSNSGKNTQKDNGTFLAPSAAPPLLRFPDEQRRMEEEIVGRPSREERVIFMNLRPEVFLSFFMVEIPPPLKYSPEPNIKSKQKADLTSLLYPRPLRHPHGALRTQLENCWCRVYVSQRQAQLHVG